MLTELIFEDVTICGVLCKCLIAIYIKKNPKLMEEIVRNMFFLLFADEVVDNEPTNDN